MKKILFTLLLSITSFVCNAQIYSKIEYYDKFDDCIRKENVKTIVNIDEDNEIITVETKGRKPIEYIVVEFEENGRKDSVVNLVGNIYGYEGHWYCIEEKDTINWKFENRKKITELMLKHNKNLDAEKIIEADSVHWYMSLNDWVDFNIFMTYENKYIKEIVERYITTQYTMQFKNRLFWIKKNDGSRIIYTNN